MTDQFVDVQAEFEAVQKAFVEWYKAKMERNLADREWQDLSEPLPQPKVIYGASDLLRWNQEEAEHGKLADVAHARMLVAGQKNTSAEFDLISALKHRGSWYKVTYGFVRRTSTGNIQFVSHEELLDQLGKGG